MKTKLTQLMCNRDKLMLKKIRLPWYAFSKKRSLEDAIGDYKRLIDLEMEEQEAKQLAK